MGNPPGNFSNLFRPDEERESEEAATEAAAEKRAPEKEPCRRLII